MNAIDTIREAGLWKEDLLILMEIAHLNGDRLCPNRWAELPDRIENLPFNVKQAYPEYELCRLYTLMQWFRRDKELTQAVLQLAEDAFQDVGIGPDWPLTQQLWAN